MKKINKKLENEEYLVKIIDKIDEDNRSINQINKNIETLNKVDTLFITMKNMYKQCISFAKEYRNSKELLNDYRMSSTNLINWIFSCFSNIDDVIFENIDSIFSSCINCMSKVNLVEYEKSVDLEKKLNNIDNPRDVINWYLGKI